MADYGGSTTNPDYRDMTQTPRWLFDALNRDFCFALDVAALPKSALCARYLTPEIDALAVDWADFLPANKRAAWCWCNPPYSDIGPWVLKAMVEQHHGIGTVMLVPQDQSAEWYPGDNASEVRIITGYYDEDGKWKTGRIAFVNAETGQEMQGNNKGSMLLVFAPGYQGPCRISHVSKGELIRQGQSVAKMRILAEKAEKAELFTGKEAAA